MDSIMIILILTAFPAILTGSIAEKKGHNARTAFAISLCIALFSAFMIALAGGIGIILYIILCAVFIVSYASKGPRQILCPKCGIRVDHTAKICPHCQHHFLKPANP